METKNAVIESVTISSDDHDCLTCWLHLDYGGSGQGFGGFALYLPKSFKHHKVLSHAGHFVFRVMEVAGVTKWQDLKGQTVRVSADHDGVQSIGHIVKDDWFNPTEDFSAAKEQLQRHPRHDSEWRAAVTKALSSGNYDGISLGKALELIKELNTKSRK